MHMVCIVYITKQRKKVSNQAMHGFFSSLKIVAMDATTISTNLTPASTRGKFWQNCSSHQSPEKSSVMLECE